MSLSAGSTFGCVLVGVDDSPESLEAAKRAAILATVDAAIEAELLVVGSRGLHGVKALGSVSERVAHEARCSVPVVR